MGNYLADKPHWLYTEDAPCKCGKAWFALSALPLPQGFEQVVCVCRTCHSVFMFVRGCNMLQNPDMETPYVAFPNYSNVETPHGWQPWWVEGKPAWSEDLQWEEGAGLAAQPEFKPVTPAIDGRWVIQGNATAKAFTQWKPWLGGLYQQVDVVAGATYRFGVVCRIGCGDADDQYNNQRQGELNVKLGWHFGGIPLTRHTWPLDPGWHWMPNWVWPGADWKEVFCEFKSESSRVTLCVMGWAKWKPKHNDLFVSHATLKRTDAAPLPEPEPGEPSPDLSELKAWIAVTSAEAWAAAAEAAVSVWKRAMEDMVGDRALAGRAHPSPRRGLWAWLAHLLCK